MFNTLKAYKVSAHQKPVEMKMDPDVKIANKKFNKWTRLSHPRHRKALKMNKLGATSTKVGFSTINRVMGEDEEAEER